MRRRINQVMQRIYQFMRWLWSHDLRRLQSAFMWRCAQRESFRFANTEGRHLVYATNKHQFGNPLALVYTRYTCTLQNTWTDVERTVLQFILQQAYTQTRSCDRLGLSIINHSKKQTDTIIRINANDRLTRANELMSTSTNNSQWLQPFSRILTV